MRKSRFSETQIGRMLKDAESGRPASDICRENGISSTTFYKWKAKFGGMDAFDVRRLKELETEHSRLKQMFAELSLENQALKDVIEKSCQASRASTSGQSMFGRSSALLRYFSEHMGHANDYISNPVYSNALFFGLPGRIRNNQ